MNRFEIISILLFLLFITIKIHGQRFGSSDYFDANFDESKNCQNQNVIKELKKMKKCQVANAGKWARARSGGVGAYNNNASKGSDAQQWENCKTELSKMLVNKCSGTKILKVN